MSQSFPASSVFGLGLTVAIAVILLGSNFTVINAQQQLQMTSQPEELGNGITKARATIFQSANDSFSIQVPDGWLAHDINNSRSLLSEERRVGYALLAQLCWQGEEGAFSSNVGGNTSNSSCEGAQDGVVHVVRYPDLDTKLLASNISTTNNNMTTADKIVPYQLQKLQEAGYRSMRILTITDMAINLTNPQTNERIATLPGKLVEMIYETNFSPNETRRGYLLSTATNTTVPDLGMTKGYAVFYESNSTATNATAPITSISNNLPAPTLVGQVLDSFEIIAASPRVAQQPSVQQAAQSDEVTQDTTDQEDDTDVDEDNEGDDNEGDDNEGDDNEGDDNEGDDNEGDDNEGDDNEGDDNEGDDNEGDDNEGDDNEGDDNEGDDNEGDDNEGDDNEGDDNGTNLDDCENIGGTSCADDYDSTADD
jgi:hypothetical protein